MITIIFSKNENILKVADQKDVVIPTEQPVVQVEDIKPEEPIPPAPATPEVTPTPPEIVTKPKDVSKVSPPKVHKADENDPLNRLVWKYKKYSDPEHPKYNPSRAEEIFTEIASEPFYGLQSLDDFTQDLYIKMTNGEMFGETAWQILKKTLLLEKWDGSKGNFIGFYANTVAHDAAMEKSRLKAKSSGMDEKEWKSSWLSAQYLRPYIKAMEEGDTEVIPPHIMDFEDYAKTGEVPFGWNEDEWKRYVKSVKKRFTESVGGARADKKAFTFDDNDKIVESTFWDRHEFRRPNRVEDAINYWNESREKLDKIIKENPELRENIALKFPDTIASAEYAEKYSETFVTSKNIVWLVDPIPELGKGNVSVNRKELNQTKRVFQYLANEYPELANSAGITKELMLQKPTMGKLGVKDKKPYKGEYYLTAEMIAPLLRTSSDRMIEIQKTYMDDVEKVMPMSILQGAESEIPLTLADPRAVDPAEEAVERISEERGESLDWEEALKLASKTDRIKKFSHKNKLLRKAVLSC